MVWLFDSFDKISDKDYDVLFTLLPSSQKEKIKKRKPEEQKIAILEYFLLKKMLKIDKDLEFKYNENGKPSLDGYYFSISHCEGVLCLASANCPVGIDIEKMHDYNEDIAKLILNGGEFNRVEKAKNKSLALTKLFTKKEAVIKCLGLNMTHVVDILNQKGLEYHFHRYNSYIICECIKKDG